MNVKCGDVVLAYVDFVGSAGGKTRPAVVVQADYYNLRLNETLIAAIASNLSQAHERSQLLIEAATLDGTATGLLHDSAVRCERIHCIPQADIKRIILKLPPNLMSQLDTCLMAAFAIP
ncbi:MAG: type II toxin-antitoxin system PemK/MazF family toxin [Gemmataceae bacterium]|nr:type II toxin-antitoxin system PemK/MazF family toxin [Gemmataceae bacterium]